MKPVNNMPRSYSSLKSKEINKNFAKGKEAYFRPIKTVYNLTLF